MPKNSLSLDPTRYIRFIHVEESCLDLPYTNEILERLELPYDVIPDRGEPEMESIFDRNDLHIGKRHLFLCRNRGRFFKPCPGTSAYRCCGYHVLSTGMNCPMDCVYCILQIYLNKPWISHFVNIENLFGEIERELSENPGKRYRIGTGEFTDSLVLDGLTRLSTKLINYCAEKDRVTLELKTKSSCIDNLQGLRHGGRTVVAWSLNATEIVAREELRTATLVQRLEAAQKCASWGYRLAFHFDPIIEHPGWKEGYAQTIERLFDMIPAEAIVWISLGAFRYIPSLKTIGTERFPGSRIFYQEFIEGLDGKARYFRSHRAEMYRFLYNLLIKKASEKTCIYFCMESDEIWKEVTGFAPEEKGGLLAMLDHAVFDD